MRPRFAVEVGCSADHVMSALRSRGERNERGIEGRFTERHGVLTVAEAERQFWSTQLGLTIRDAEQGADGAEVPTQVFGVFSPSPEIWTAFVFMIGVLTAIGVFGTMYGLVQITMGHTPWGLLAPLLAALVGGLVYTSTLVGQGLAAGEMYELRSHLDDCVADAEALARQTPSTAEESAQL
jgi:hypothetical protein